MAERPCQVCQHPSRPAIEQALVNGKGHRDIARTFGIGSGVFGTDSFKPDHKKVARHLDQHMAAAYAAATETTQQESGEAIIARLAHLDLVVDEVIARHREGIVLLDGGLPVLDENTGNPVRHFQDRTLLGAIREARRNAELRARLVDALPEGDDDAVEQARKALESPEVRARLADIERVMSDGAG